MAVQADNSSSSKQNTPEEIIKQYALGLNTLDLSKFAFLLHADFKFTYCITHNLSHSLKTDLRYIGHMYKAFYILKAYGLGVKTAFCYVTIGQTRQLCIKLLPTHYRPILFPLDFQMKEILRKPILNGEVLLIPKVIDGCLCSVECYVYKQDFNKHVGGIVEGMKWVG